MDTSPFVFFLPCSASIAETAEDIRATLIHFVYNLWSVLSSFGPNMKTAITLKRLLSHALAIELFSAFKTIFIFEEISSFLTIFVI